MFNWVCPQCGKDVPPSKTECPFCAERAREAALAGPPPPQPGAQPVPPQGWYQQAPPPQAWQPQPPPPQAWPAQPPPPQPVWPQQAPAQPWQPAAYEPTRPAPPPPPPPPPPAPPQYQPAPPPQWGGPPQPPTPQYAPPPPAAPAWAPPPEQVRTGPPTWLIAVGVTLAFLGILSAIYFFIQHSGKPTTAEKAGLESPAAPSQQKVANPMQKYVEVVGIRMLSENKKPVAKFVVVNHSGAEIPDLAANVTLWASTSRSDEDLVGTFSFKVSNLGANESKELSEPLNTKRKMYELPDWQNATPDIEITSPQP